MSWHTIHNKTSTHFDNWHYYAHIVAPLELLINFDVKYLYLLETCFIKKPKHPV